MIVSQESVCGEKFSVREREDENNQEEVVKSQSALHVAHFGSTLAKIFWLDNINK